MRDKCSIQEDFALLEVADECVRAARADDRDTLGAVIGRAETDGLLGDLLDLLATVALGCSPSADAVLADLATCPGEDQFGTAGFQTKRVIEWLVRSMEDGDDGGIALALRAAPASRQRDAVAILATVLAEKLTEEKPLTCREIILRLITLEAHDRGWADIAEPLHLLVGAYWRQTHDAVADVMRTSLPDEQALRRAAEVLAALVGLRVGGTSSKPQDADPEVDIEEPEDGLVVFLFRLAWLAHNERFDQLRAELRTGIPDGASLTELVGLLAMTTSVLLAPW